MLTVIKIILLIVFMFFTSKALGIYICEKINKEKEEKIAIGFLANLALFFLCEFITMFLKLSSTYLNIFGSLYLVIVVLITAKCIKNKKLFKITKKEIIALILVCVFMLLYMFFIHFGYIETYDSYFYSVLTNSAQNTEHISTIDPYTGQNNLQNYYKYISYYYQASFLANIAGIENGYLVLIWVMTFMNYFFISITAITLVRVTRNKSLNNILSAFFLTFVLSVFRAPFNALHLVTMILSIQCFTYMFDLFKGEKTSLYLLLICIIAGISITSTIMFVMVCFVYIFYIVACILRRKDLFNSILYIATPVFILLFLYIYESLDNIYVIAIMLFILTMLYILFRNKKFIEIIAKLGYPLLIIAPAILIFMGTPLYNKGLSELLTKKDIVDSNMQIVSSVEQEGQKDNFCEGKDNTCEEKNLILKYAIDDEIHSSSMKYIYQNNTNILSTVLILVTHSSVLYGGIAFLFIYGIIKLRKKPEFLSLLIYIIVLYNPLVKKGISTLTLGLEGRIYLFFNTIFGILGIYYLLELTEEKIKNKKVQNVIERIWKYGSYAYMLLVTCSILIYVLQFNAINSREYSLVAKVPNTLIQANNYFNKYIEQNDNKGYTRVFYTANTFNMSMIDKNVNKKIKIINSKEYMSYFENKEKVITNKLIISAFFDTEGECYLYNESEDNLQIKEENIQKLIKYFNIQYIAYKTPKTSEFKDYIERSFEIIYTNDDVQIIKVR